MFNLAIAWLSYKLFEEILQNLCDYTNRGYLTALEDYLKRARLLYEQEKMGEDEYKRLEAELTRTIKGLRAQLAPKPGRRQLDIRL